MKAVTKASERNITKRLSAWTAVVAVILMIPLLANFPWTGSDFVFAGVALFGAASVYELVTKNVTDPNRRLAIGAIVLITLALIWGMAATGE